ncbi:hypothetical protein Fmac_023036 [Flemingia macrophylla]|uniref:FAD-binding domain-containing protein n=1 Tax=Flemingia macrophylla TaxID=520843 RepID=A0ABD1LKK2_9FABA
METNVVEDIVIVGAGIAGLTRSLGFHRNITTSLVTGQQTSTTYINATGKHRNIEIGCVKRKLMLKALVDELPSGTVRYRSKVVATEESGFYKIVHLADGTTIKTKWWKIGLASRTPLLLEDIQSGVVQSSRPITGLSRISCISFKGFRVVVVPCDERAVYWFFTWTPTSQSEISKTELEKMPSNVRSVIEKTEVDSFVPAPSSYRHPWELMLGNINKGNVCVAGDAFHPMTPDVGQSGFCALEDGIDFSQERRWRSIDVTFTSYMVGSIQQAESKLVSFLRDNILAAFLANICFKKSVFDCGKLNSS